MKWFLIPLSFNYYQFLYVDLKKNKLIPMMKDVYSWFISHHTHYKTRLTPSDLHSCLELTSSNTKVAPILTGI